MPKDRNARDGCCESETGSQPGTHLSRGSESPVPCLPRPHSHGQYASLGTRVYLCLRARTARGPVHLPNLLLTYLPQGTSPDHPSHLCSFLPCPRIIATIVRAALVCLLCARHHAGCLHMHFYFPQQPEERSHIVPILQMRKTQPSPLPHPRSKPEPHPPALAQSLSAPCSPCFCVPLHFASVPGRPPRGAEGRK